ncbi:MAG: hypothetical protein KBE16_00360 [Alphaproteobacteria bacterium]|nr:hypothetical protein [Alphaproteobacteria bacterium]
MTSRDFCFWLQGYFEIHKIKNNTLPELSHSEVVVIANHLNMVFKHDIDPSMGPKPHQDALSALHAGLSLSDQIARC